MSLRPTGLVKAWMDYHRGLDELSHVTVGDDGISMWENKYAYHFGDIVRHNERYWKADGDIYPPMFPSFMSGEVPGESEHWKPVGNSFVRDMVKGAVIGAIDIQDWQRQMNTLKQVPVNVANVMLRYGQQVIIPLVAADELRAKQAFMSALPGASNRATVKGKLQWHADRLGESNAAMAQLRADPKKFNTTPQQIDATMYAPGDDLKKWVTQAFIEANAMEEGLATLQAAWDRMWAEIKTELAKLPKEALKAVASAAGGAIEAMTGVPLWGLILGGVALTAGVGYLGYRVLKTDMAKTYLGRR